MGKKLILPEAGQWVVQLPNGTIIDVRAGRRLHEFEIPIEKKALREQLAENYTGNNEIVCPVTFDETLDRQQIVISDGRITGYLERTPFVNVANRTPLMLSNLRFANNPWLVSVQGGPLTCRQYLIFGDVDPDIRYWVLLKNRKQKMVTIPEEWLTEKQAKCRKPLRINGLSSLRQLGFPSSGVEVSCQFLSFKRCERSDGRYAYEGDVNFIHVWDSPLMIRDALSAFGAERLKDSSLIFVAQTEEGISELEKSGQRLWPNLCELLSRDLHRLS